MKVKKSLQIYIQVDDVELSNLEGLQDALEEVFEEYPDKRITITLQDDVLVRPPRR
jgi:hypothetical protein